MPDVAPGLDRALRYAEANRGRFVAELSELVRFPSVSADPRHASDVRACARWLASHLDAIGMGPSRVVPTTKHPIVVAESREAGVQRPTVLVYGHYDVQPPDPLDEWTTPPFAPVVRNGALYGRGACDDKGQLFAHVKALESWRRATGSVPVNVVCMLEGEEEIGSDGLREFLGRNRAEIRADVAVLSDMLMRGVGRPTVTYSVRGELALEMELDGTDRDLHSGQFGGGVHNPAQAIAEMLATLHDQDGRIAVPGFYNGVRPLSLAERRYMARVAPSDAEILEAAGAEIGWGEPGYSLYERTTARPSLSINGITTGYGGAGHKSVIPSSAAAKLSARLVPDQDPDAIDVLLRRHLVRVTPPTMRLSITPHFAVPPAQVDLDDGVLQVAHEACTRSFGRPPVFVRLGGTIPVVSTFHRTLRIPPVMIGFALPDDRIHAPDEHFELSNFFNGIDTSIRFLGLLAASGGQRHDRRLSLPRREGRRAHRAVGY